MLCFAAVICFYIAIGFIDEYKFHKQRYNERLEEYYETIEELNNPYIGNLRYLFAQQLEDVREMMRNNNEKMQQNRNNAIVCGVVEVVLIAVGLFMVIKKVNTE